MMGPFVGVVELVCGALIIIGLFTRLATIPLIVTMIVALIATKLRILLGYGFGPFGLPDFKRDGLWSAQHESCADLTMLLGCLYLSIIGSGRWSIDRLLAKDAADDQQAHGRRAETHRATPPGPPVDPQARDCVSVRTVAIGRKSRKPLDASGSKP
jgi:uncharacterized membrane protein YphA (DoxX/SURF4 family)